MPGRNAFHHGEIQIRSRVLCYECNRFAGIRKSYGRFHRHFCSEAHVLKAEQRDAQTRQRTPKAVFPSAASWNYQASGAF